MFPRHGPPWLYQSANGELSKRTPRLPARRIIGSGFNIEKVDKCEKRLGFGNSFEMSKIIGHMSPIPVALRSLSEALKI